MGANLAKVSNLVKQKNRDWDSRASYLIQKREADSLEMGWSQNTSCMQSPCAQTTNLSKQEARSKHSIFQIGQLNQ